ncbi:hypothetical protein BDZ94DRAFT_114005 [Collybia nuda]|uniref:Nephrocystin 3-like N-terminal domain-containing protein n=1 Tax=Collybia nuda TaxID=64659 RepID=A0A9P5XZ30_9AGAR|nr:hypothetical protein BDZ94DRAFT_114005 [Collybia nuda]
MAFAQSSNFTINHSTFIDKSTITKKSISPTAKNRDGKGLQILINACSPEALFDSQARHPPPICHPSTRIGLLDHIFRWVDRGEEDILFLDGPAGVGKSAVAQTVAARSAARKTLGGSFFFFRGSSSRNTVAPLIPTITHQIIAPSPRKRKKVAKAIELDPFIFDKSPEVQLRKLIIQPLCSSVFLWNKLSQRKRRLLIVDGLDECIDDNGQCQIVNLLGQLVDKDCGIVRCLIASRSEPHIISAVNSLKIKVARVTLNEQSWGASGDLRMYLRSGIDDIFSRRNLPQPWPSETIIDTLTEKAGGIFIYASTVLKYMEDPDSLPIIQLEHVLSLIPETTPFAALDQLYQEILTACPAQHRSTLLHIFGIIFLHNPQFKDFVDVLLIEAILGLSSGEVAMVLRRMHSIIAFRESDSKTTITFLHASFGDFLFNRERSGQFFVDIFEEEWSLAGKCMNYLGHRDRGGLFSVVYWRSTSYYTHGIHGSTMVPELAMLTMQISPKNFAFVTKVHGPGNFLWIITIPVLAGWKELLHGFNTTTPKISFTVLFHLS